MPESLISATGRTTVPREIRDRLGARAGMKLAWRVMQGGAMLVHVVVTRVPDTSPGNAARARRER